MNSKMIKSLSARKQPTDRDKLDFSCRIKASDYIISIDEAVDIINHIATDRIITVSCGEGYTKINLDESNVLEMNLIDEVICSIIHNIFLCRKNNDVDTLGYIRYRLEETIPSIESTCNNLYASDDKRYEYIARLNMMIINICTLSLPSTGPKTNEERFEYKLSIDYYALMYFICNLYSSNDDYFAKLQSFYCRRIVKENEEDM